MCCNKHDCFITLLTKTNAANLSLPDSARIRNNTVKSIQMRRPGTATYKAYDGSTLASDAVVGTGSITLKDQNGNEILSNFPLTNLQRDYNSPEPMAVKYDNIDPIQTAIVIDTTSANAAHVLEIVFEIACEICGK